MEAVDPEARFHREVRYHAADAVRDRIRQAMSEVEAYLREVYPDTDTRSAASQDVLLLACSWVLRDSIKDMPDASRARLADVVWDAVVDGKVQR